MSRAVRRLVPAAPAALLLSAAPAGAVSVRQDYACTHSLLDVPLVTAQFTAELPTTWPTTSALPARTLAASLTLRSAAIESLGLLSTASVEGTAGITATYDGAGLSPARDVAVALAVPTTTVPAPNGLPSQTMTLTANGLLPGVSFPATGQARLGLDGLRLNLRIRNGQGQVIRIGSSNDSDGNVDTFDVVCVRQAASPTQLAAIDIFQDQTPPAQVTGLRLDGTPGETSAQLLWTAFPAATSYLVSVNGVATSVSTNAVTLTGLTKATAYTAQVRAVRGDGTQSLNSEPLAFTTAGSIDPDPDPVWVPLDFSTKATTLLRKLTANAVTQTGSFNGQLDVTSGAVEGDLQLGKGRTRLLVATNVPVVADIVIVPSGPTTGTFTGGVLRTNSRMRVRLPQLYLFGAIPLVPTPTCQTRSLSTIQLVSATGFEPLTGGTVSGTFAISELSGCGALNGIIASTVADATNTISVVLTPPPVAEQ